MADTSFKLKSLESIFAVTDPNSKQKNDTVFSLPVDKLLPFNNHPFKLYSGQRFDDMVDSVKANGVIIPIIVRPIDDFTYEILSGHNRVESAKAAGLINVPSIIKEGLTDDEALLIVTETNLVQRSFTDLSHSERAVTLSMHHDAIKKQGKHKDLVFEIENLLKASDIEGSNGFSQVGKKLYTHELMSESYCLSKNTIARYLRLNNLTKAIIERVDMGDIAFLSAVALSYLTETEQQIVNEVLNSGNYKLDMKKADALRILSEQKKLTPETAEEIFTGKEIKKKYNSDNSPNSPMREVSEAEYQEALAALQITAEEVEQLEQEQSEMNPQETELEQLPMGKYGILARNYLKEHHPGRYTFLILEAQLEEICLQVDREANDMMETIQTQLRQQTPRPKGDFIAIAQYETMIRDQAEEVVLREIVYRRR